jgi:hypothetical protein
MSQNNPEMDFNITDLPIPQQFAISNEDIQKRQTHNYLGMFNYSGSFFIWFTNSV